MRQAVSGSWTTLHVREGDCPCTDLHVNVGGEYACKVRCHAVANSHLKVEAALLRRRHLF